MPSPSASNGGWSVLVGASNEADLIQKSRDGDSTSYVSLIQLHDAHLRRFAYNSCGSTDLMDSVLEEVYLEAFGALRAGIDEPPFGTWLFRRIFEGCEVARSNLGEDYSESFESDLQRTLFEMPLDNVAAISIVAGERVDADEAAALLSTEKKPFLKMVKDARASLDKLDLGEADALIAEYRPARHSQDFWIAINRSFNASNKPQTNGDKKDELSKAKGNRRWLPRVSGLVALVAAAVITLVAMFGGGETDANPEEGSAPAPAPTPISIDA